MTSENDKVVKEIMPREAQRTLTTAEEPSPSVLQRLLCRALKKDSSWNLLRLLAMARQPFVRKGSVTVVIVTYNTCRFLGPTLEAVRKFSPPDTRIIVIDNNSTDGTKEFLQKLERQEIQSVLLPCNIRHGPAADLGFLMARSEFIVSLDVDAFPLTSDWLDRLLTPLRAGKTLVGAKGGRVLDRLLIATNEEVRDREFVHPCWLAMRADRFIKLGHSFCKEGDLDVGERISKMEADGLQYIDPTEIRGPGALGTVFGGTVYHNFYSARKEDAVVDGIPRKEVLRAWAEACDRFLGIKVEEEPIG
jgi:glycosyltransferase involved in cell wall biosynthesis